MSEIVVPSWAMYSQPSKAMTDEEIIAFVAKKDKKSKDLDIERRKANLALSPRLLVELENISFLNSKYSEVFSSIQKDAFVLVHGVQARRMVAQCALHLCEKQEGYGFWADYISVKSELNKFDNLRNPSFLQSLSAMWLFLDLEYAEYLEFDPTMDQFLKHRWEHILPVIIPYEGKDISTDNFGGYIQKFKYIRI
jgi:hypothetical protein